MIHLVKEGSDTTICGKKMRRLIGRAKPDDTECEICFKKHKGMPAMILMKSIMKTKEIYLWCEVIE